MRWRSLLLLLCVSLTVSKVRADDRQVDDTERLARRSLVGPRVAITTGALLLLATPAIAIGAGFSNADGMAWLGCEDWHSGRVDESCEAEDQAADERFARTALGVGLASALVANGLIALGIVQAVRIRRARRRVLLEAPRVALGRRSAQLEWSLAF